MGGGGGVRCSVSGVEKEAEKEAVGPGGLQPHRLGSRIIGWAARKWHFSPR